MLQLISDLPPHVAGLHAFAEVTETEYEEALIPIMDELLQRNRKINFVLILETDIKNFVDGAWCGNTKIGFKYFFDWGRVALVTDQKGILGYSDLFKYIIPGKFRYFPLDQLDTAIRWISAK
ncbi:STAS/SEC14 domain-containing protein [Mucilaginibacter sp. BJC16-A38]|uniref:STAS/SEC14 domain-containing protein n=1 Tax=Mucilaginibacter phenanthrenivorans TaxID=1234842 RepID=UPI002157BA67|nr:STAS/SEC14 domain-containing protein [Mucilaginibacter phenanthrenivorans]MCR8556458.1 STAS/SEC14 domain-containing protein [Mucilaginibacter phenanthrenivorans]